MKQAPITEKWTLTDLVDAWADLAKQEKALIESRKSVKEKEDDLLAQVCPHVIRESRFVPLTKTTGLRVERLLMSKPFTPDRLPHWTAYGTKVRFRVGNIENVGPYKIEQPLYMALPKEIQELTLDGMIENSKEQKLTGIDKPLKLTDIQITMISLMASKMDGHQFSPKKIDGGQTLSPAIWASSSSTQLIWTAMVKRGVLVIEKGDMSKPWGSWRVNPGPRFEEAVALVGGKLNQSRPGAPTTQNFIKHFGVKAKGPKP